MKMARSKLESNLWRYKLIKLIADPFFVTPIIVLFLLARGLSFTEVFILEAVFAASVLVFELPTGALGDILGRRKTLVISNVIYIISWLVYAVGDSFAQFAAAEIMIAFSIAMNSGTETSLIYDTLAKLKKEKQFKKVVGEAQSNTFIASVLGTSVAGLVYAFNNIIPFILTAVFSVISLLLVFGYIEPATYDRKKFSIKNYVSQIKVGALHAITQFHVRWLIIYAAILSIFGIVGFWYYQPFMQQVGLDVKYFGFAFAGFNLVAATTSRYAHQLEEKLGERLSLALLPVLLIISFVLMSRLFYVWAISLIALQQIVRAYASPVVGHYINEYLESDKRATALSVQGMISRLGLVIALPFFGWVVDFYSLNFAMELTALIVFLLIILLFIAYKFSKKSK